MRGNYLMFWLLLFGVSATSDVNSLSLRSNFHEVSHRNSEYLVKYNITPPESLSFRATASPKRNIIRDDVSFGRVGAQLSPDSQAYLSPITVGEGDHATTFSVVFDTGSPLFWLFSDISVDENLNGSNVLYTPLNSTTAEATGSVFNISYGSGSFGAFGIVFNDTVSIGDITVRQKVGAAFQSGNSQCDLDICNFTLDGFDGILGLSPGNSFLSNLFFGGSEHPTLPVFTVSLTRLNEPEGFYTFGYIDDELVGNNTIQYTSVDTTHGFWGVTSPFVVINGFRIDTPEQNVIIDTGTTQILLPDELLPIIYEPLNGVFNTSLQSWVFPSNFTSSQLPTIVLPVGEHNVTLAPEDIIFQITDGLVIGALQPGGTNFSVFGDFWLRNVYAIFELDVDGLNNKFGFIPRAPNPV